MWDSLEDGGTKQSFDDFHEGGFRIKIVDFAVFD